MYYIYSTTNAIQCQFETTASFQILSEKVVSHLSNNYDNFFDDSTISPAIFLEKSTGSSIGKPSIRQA